MESSALLCVLMGAILQLVQGYNRLLTFTEPEQYLDICLDGILHKSKPGPEADLFDQCSPWKDHSCCTKEITDQLHANQTWYKMDYNHCPSQPMSSKCRSRFTQDLCFYECSPNVGPWLVKVNGMTIRNERFIDVPLCHTECSAWWEDCEDDYTCVENWSREFNWSTGFPECPETSTCQKFSEVYQNSSHFCETVFDHSWKVVSDDTPSGCFIMWWNGTENPNRGIALEKAQSIVSGAGLSSVSSSSSCFLLLSVLVVSFVKFMDRFR